MTPLSARLRRHAFFAFRAVFRAVPMRESTRDAMRTRFLRAFPRIRPVNVLPIRLGHTTSTGRVRSDEPCLGYVERSDRPAVDSPAATLVAFYLPQFHTIPENDQWWGRGFTEWRNVARARPQFDGHLQPRLPADLGFYDLRNPQVMRQQSQLAKHYGLSAFCFYFYWFDGRTLLEEPLRNWLSDPSIDFGYCLCWANENWTRRWDGRDDDILIAQEHSPDDDVRFIAHVADYLRDPRYLRVDGKPVLLIYRPMLLPDPKQTAARWRTWCRDNGIGEIHLAYAQSFERPDPLDIGFDAAVEFPPNRSRCEDITCQQHLLNPGFTGSVLRWTDVAAQRDAAKSRGLVHPAVNCGWDNEPRRPGNGRVYLHATPSAYRDWLMRAIRNVRGPVFINAWNEWAEGAILEPDATHGHAYLAATRDALTASPVPAAPRHAIVVHAWFVDVLPELCEAIVASGLTCPVIVTTTHDRASSVREVLQRFPLEASVVAMENRGRDVLPFLRIAHRLRQDGVDVVLKIHTKRSTHRADGDTWRRQIVSSLLPPGSADLLLQRMRSDGAPSILAPDGHIQPLSYYWGANEETVRRLCRRLGLAPPDPERDRFIAGSMFWIRLRSIERLLDGPLFASEFEDEAGQVDGTFAHAIERVFALVASGSGGRIDTVGGDSVRDAEPFAFAARD